MFKKMLSVSLVLMLLSGCALSEGLHIALPMEGLTEIEEIDGERVCMSEDGNTRIELLTLEPSGMGLCGESTLEDLCELRTNCPESFEIAVLSEEPFESYPAKRVAYTYEVGDGMTYKAQAMAVWTDGATFVVFVLGEDDAFADAVFASMAFSED